MNIDIRSVPDGCVVRLAGELDHHAAKSVIQEVSGYIEHNLCRNVTFDMSWLSFMDSSGIAVIVNTYKRVTALGGRVCVKNAARQPARVLKTAGLGKIVDIEEAV